jgi:hypothetical protein
MLRNRIVIEIDYMYEARFTKLHNFQYTSLRLHVFETDWTLLSADSKDCCSVTNVTLHLLCADWK